MKLTTQKLPCQVDTKHGRSAHARTRTGFRDTIRFEVLLEDMANMLKLHFPQIEQWQAEQAAYDLIIGVMESKYLVQR